MESLLETPPCASCSTGVRTPDYSSVSDWPGIWIIAQANPQHLQHVQAGIEDTGVPVYIPRVIVRAHDRKVPRDILKPLFPGGYLFAAVPYPELMPSTRRDWEVSSLTHVADQDQLREELSAIQRSIQANPRGRTFESLRKGRMMEVVRGSLLIRGLKGPIDRTPTGYRLWLNLTILGRSTPVEIDINDVEPC